MNKLEKSMSISKSVEKTSAAGEKKAEPTDLELVASCRQGDEMAFTQLVQRYQQKVYTVALGMVRRPEDAMDIAQEGFVKVHRYIGNFQGSSSFYTWLYRIVVNLCIDHLRKRGRYASDEYEERIHTDDSGHAKGTVLSTGLDSNPSRNLGRKELVATMQSAINDLPPYHRAVILMREIEGMSYADMARALNVSKGTVMSRLHHARQKLQVALRPYLEGNFRVEE